MRFLGGACQFRGREARGYRLGLRKLGRGEVWGEELILLKLLAPWQLWDFGLSTVDQTRERLGTFQVNSSREALPLTTDSVRITVGLDETDVGLDHWPLISNPESLCILERIEGPSLERLGVSGLHLSLVVVLSDLSGLLVVQCDLTHDLGVVPEDDADGLSLEDALLNSVAGLLSPWLTVLNVRWLGVAGRDEELEVTLGSLAESCVLW